MKEHILTLTVAGAAAVWFAAPAGAETLSVAQFEAPTHVVHEAVIDPFSEGVTKATDGDLELDVYVGGELGAGPADQYTRALQGVADITWGLPGYTSSQFSHTMIAEMPGVLEGDRQGYQAVWDAYEAGHLEGEFPGTKPLALWGSEPNIFIMKDHEVRSPEDIAGLNIRVSGSTAGATIRALGGTPIHMPAGEIYNALQTGLIDGVVTGASAVNDFKLDEVANSYTLGAPLGHITFFFVMNQDRFDGLPEEMQAAIENQSGRDLSRHAEETWKASAARTIEALREDESNTVIDLTEEEAEAFGELTRPVAGELVAELGAEDTLAVMRGE